MQQDGIDVQMAASLSATGIGSVNTETQVKSSQEKKDKFERAVEKTLISTVGSKPPSDGSLFLHLIEFIVCYNVVR